LNKPTYYLWKNNFSTQEDFEKAKETYKNLGFRVVTYLDTANNNDILVGLKEIIKNHYGDSSFSHFS